MTKTFEEEAIKEVKKCRVVMNAYDGESNPPKAGLNLKLGRATHNFPWLEFAKNWHSDEEFQDEIKKLTDQLITRNDELISSNYEIESLKTQLISRKKQVLELKEADKAQGKEIANLKSQLQQQALPVVPECVGEFVSGDENELSKADRIAYLLKSVQGDSYYLTEELPGDGTITVDEGQELYNWAICQHHETILKLWNGYTVEKPQLFKVVFPNSTSVLQKNGELNSFADTVYKRYLIENAMTEQEIKSIDERYWQFAVPVEDGE